LECCGGECGCPNGLCGCGKACDGCCSEHMAVVPKDLSKLPSVAEVPVPASGSCCSIAKPMTEVGVQ